MNNKKTDVLIEIEDLTKDYCTSERVTTKALRGITLNINEGEFVAIMGPSGSGKSTLMHILGFLDTPTKGKYFFNGKRTHNFNDDQLADIRNQQVGFVFQAFNLLPRTSAMDNVRIPMVYAGLSSKEQEKKSLEVLKLVGLENRADHYPNELSGGQQQRVAIARALVNNPKVIFADEPTGNLDTASSKEIMAIFRELNNKGNTIIMVTHENSVAAYAKRALHLQDGLIHKDHKHHK